MNKWALKRVLTRNGDTAKDLAVFLDISVTSLYNKMNEHGTEFHLSEISMIRSRYDLNADEIEEVFFTS